LPFHRDGSGLAELIALQARLIDHAVGLLAPGGRLVFATCSLLTAEGEDQIRAARSRHPGLGVIPAALPGLSRGQLTDEGGLRLLPHQGPAGGWDGFYMACLTRPA
jgi:16S rRNA (cytosine967-C5)-methyltransferase